MTIIQPNKTNHKTNFLMTLLMFVLIIVAVWGVFLYNQLVNVRHEAEKQKVDLQRAEVTNAELKNNLYSVIDEKNLKSVTNQQSLIFDKNPQYLKTEQLAAN
jgi:cell division protein FtsB